MFRSSLFWPLSFGCIWVGSFCIFGGSRDFQVIFLGEFLILRNKKRPKIVMSRGGYQAVAFGDLHYQFLKPRHLRCMAHNLPVHFPKPTGFSNMSFAFTYSYSWKTGGSHFSWLFLADSDIEVDLSQDTGESLWRKCGNAFYSYCALAW